MGVPLRDGDGAFVDGQSVDVERGREVDGGAHGAKAVNAQKVVADTNGRGFLAVELPRDSAVLEIQGLAVGTNNNIGFGGGGRRRRGWKSAAGFRTGSGFQVNAVNGRRSGMLQARYGEVGDASWLRDSKSRTGARTLGVRDGRG